VRLTPIGFALVTITVTQEKGFEPMTATAMIIDGIGASAAQIANGFVGSFRHIDGGEFTGPKEPRDGTGIPLIGFERGARQFGDEGRSGNQTRDLELFEASGDHKAAGTGFIGHLQEGTRMSFADAAEGFFQALDIIGDGAEDTDLTLRSGFGDGNGDGVLMDIETEV
jgi:hypothetical protein